MQALFVPAAPLLRGVTVWVLMQLRRWLFLWRRVFLNDVFTAECTSPQGRQRSSRKQPESAHVALFLHGHNTYTHCHTAQHERCISDVVTFAQRTFRVGLQLIVRGFVRLLAPGGPIRAILPTCVSRLAVSFLLFTLLRTDCRHRRSTLGVCAV